MGADPLATRSGSGAHEPRVDTAETRSRRPYRAVVLLLAVVVGVLADISSRAHAGAPSEYIKERIEKIYDLVGVAGSVEAASPDRRAAARKVLDEMFDWTEMGRRTLDKHWAERSASERSEFVRLFSELFQRTYLSRIHLAEREKFQFLSDTIDGDRAAVKTKVVTRKGQEIPVDYLTARSNGDRWKIYDLDVSGVSLIGNYRAQFTGLIERSSYSEFIDKLRALVDKRPARSPRDGFVLVGAGDMASGVGEGGQATARVPDAIACMFRTHHTSDSASAPPAVREHLPITEFTSGAWGSGGEGPPRPGSLAAAA
jgi:phospholipid transport system substrate-binding protein